MASTYIIRKVTESLLAFLRHDLASITTISSNGIRAGRPETTEGGQVPETLLLYLYQVIESPYLRNVGPRVEEGATPGAVTIRRDPLALDLYYLMVPTSGDTTFLDTYDILGAAMRSMHDHAVFTLGEWTLDGSTPELTDEEKNLQIRVEFNRLETADLIRIWEAVHSPYRLSVSYVVRTLQIESQITSDTKRVRERRLDFRQSP